MNKCSFFPWACDKQEAVVMSLAFVERSGDQYLT